MTYTQKDVEELVAAAKENGIELSAADAENALAEMQGELSDDDLSPVSGGYGNTATPTLQVGDRVLYRNTKPAVVTRFVALTPKNELYSIMFDDGRVVPAFLRELTKI